MTATPSELRWGKEKCLLPCLVSPVPSQGGEAGTGVGKWGLRGGVVDPVTIQLQVRPVDQVGSRPLVLLIVHIEALSWGASGVPWAKMLLMVSLRENSSESEPVPRSWSEMALAERSSWEGKRASTSRSSLSPERAIPVALRSAERRVFQHP